MEKDSREECFQYQLDILKMEIQNIDTLISRMDEMAQATKNWAIGMWTGSIAIMLSQPGLRGFVILSAIPPLLFWYIDANFRRLQNRSIFRANKITKFLNGEDIAQSFEEKRLVNFIVLDPTGRQYAGESEYKRFASFKRTIKFKEVRVFYLVLILLSLGLGAFFLLQGS